MEGPGRSCEFILLCIATKILRIFSKVLLQSHVWMSAKDAKRDAQGCVGLGTRSMPRYSYRIRARSHKLLKDNHELLPLAIPHLVYVDCILNSNCL
jgi:hypothetical protein